MYVEHGLDLAETGDMRLRDAVTSDDGNAQYGRLQVFGRGGWGTVCDPRPTDITRFDVAAKEIDEATIQIACGELGFSSGVKTRLAVRTFALCVLSGKYHATHDLSRPVSGPTRMIQRLCSRPVNLACTLNNSPVGGRSCYIPFPRKHTYHTVAHGCITVIPPSSWYAHFICHGHCFLVQMNTLSREERRNPILLGGLSCEGDESSLLECPGAVIGEGPKSRNCGVAETLSVICFNKLDTCASRQPLCPLMPQSNCVAGVRTSTHLHCGTIVLPELHGCGTGTMKLNGG